MNALRPAGPQDYAAWILAVAAVVTVIRIHLLPAPIAGTRG